ncbi:MAG: hypothetical protein ACYC0X_03865 [Pirellulaceae bacterium]
MNSFMSQRSKLRVAGFTFLVLAAAASTTVQAGKPAPPATPPPVHYGIQFWTWPQGDGAQINQMNTYGQVVGKCWNGNGTGEVHGFLYDPLTNPATAIDVNTCDISGIPPGLMIGTATGINDLGIIVGCLLPEGSAIDGSVRIGYVLDTTVTPFVLELLPDPEGSQYFSWVRINNFGDILMSCRKDNGRYTAYIYRWRPDGTDGTIIPLNLEITAPGVYMSNSTQVALQVDDGSSGGAACRWSPLTGMLEPLGGTSTNVHGINFSGTVCGRTTAKPPKGPSNDYPFRYTNSLEVLYGQTGMAWAINSDSDLFVHRAGFSIKSYVYQNALKSFYDVDSLIDPSDPNAALWSSKGSVTAVDMNDRLGDTGFGQLVGMIRLADGSQWCYLLTPNP